VIYPSKTGNSVLLETVGGDGTIIPARAFACDVAAADLFDNAVTLHAYGQLPHA